MNEKWNALDEYEEWRDVPGYVGMYQASSHGRVRSVQRLLQCEVDKGQRIQKTMLKPGRNKQGRLQVAFSFISYEPPWHANVRRFQLHRVVYAAFHGPIPEGVHILHADGNHLNNAITNLYAGTQRHGTPTEGESHTQAKLTEDQARRIKFGNERQIDLAKEFGVTQVAISHIRTGKAWKHLTPSQDTQPTTVPTPGLFD